MRNFSNQNSYNPFSQAAKYITRTCVFAGMIVVLSSCLTQKSEGNINNESIFDTLESEGIISMTISTDMNSLMENKDETTYQKATLEVAGESYKIQVKPRGKTRKAICDFPPLKLNFSEQALQNRGLANYDKLKLVTHCQGDEDLVLKEYLTYKMYNTLTENSFRVQLAKIRYIDESGETAPMEKYGFIIENNQEMADRIGGRLLKNTDEKLKSIDANQYRMLTLFQYMVGNTDWNLSKRHNIKMVKPVKQNAPIPVPYDFDYAGLVNAPYAKPHPQLPIESVTDRFFQWRGKCANGFDETLALFKDKKEDLLSFCNAFDLLDEASKNEMISYINSFYEIIEHQDKLEDNLAIVANADACQLS
jgi:hypothetical protein